MTTAPRWKRKHMEGENTTPRTREPHGMLAQPSKRTWLGIGEMCASRCIMCGGNDQPSSMVPLGLDACGRIHPANASIEQNKTKQIEIHQRYEQILKETLESTTPTKWALQVLVTRPMVICTRNLYRLTVFQRRFHIPNTLPWRVEAYLEINKLQSR